MSIIKGKTASGFEWEVDSDVLTSWEFIDYQRKAGDDIDAGMDGIVFLFGDEQFARLLEFKRQKGGKRYVPIEDIQKEVEEVIAAIGENEETKNL